MAKKKIVVKERLNVHFPYKITPIDVFLTTIDEAFTKEFNFICKKHPSLTAGVAVQQYEEWHSDALEEGICFYLYGERDETEKEEKARLKREEKAKIKKAKEREQKRLQDQKDKEVRKELYLKLKKEFENE